MGEGVGDGVLVGTRLELVLGVGMAYRGCY